MAYCMNCSGHLESRHGDYVWTSDQVGTLTVENADYEICMDCGEAVFSFETADAIDAMEEQKLREWLEDEPIGCYITAQQAADIIGITKQAFSKNARIRRGFIYHVERDGKKLYHRESVDQYRDSADGRFRIDVSKHGKRTEVLLKPPATVTWPTLGADSRSTSISGLLETKREKRPEGRSLAGSLPQDEQLEVVAT